MWARKYDKCIQCGTDERKHYGKGLCYRCYNNAAYARDPEPAKARSRNYYQDNAEHCKASVAKRYRAKHAEALAYMRTRREEIYFSGMRETILERDGYCCTKCATADDLTVHHKDGKGRGTKKPNNDPRNLVTLCRACHIRVHLPRLGTGKKRTH